MTTSRRLALRWEPCGLLAAGLLGTYLGQSAFRAGARCPSACPHRHTGTG